MIGKRILVVEDEQIVARDLRNLLKRMGHVPLGPAVSGREAIRMAQESLPDLILMDIKLDGPMDGVEASKKIVAHQPIPIVYVTAYPGEFIRNSGEMVYPFLCAAKPFSESALEAVIRSALESSTVRLH